LDISLGALVVVVWSTISSALENTIVRSSTSSVSNILIKVFSVVWVSGSGSYTFTVSHISADNISTVVVVPEVVGGDWSPVSISTSSIDPTFSGVSEFFTSLLPSSYPWFTRASDMSLSALVIVVWSTMSSALEDALV
jgi:hypothetical protein